MIKGFIIFVTLCLSLHFNVHAAQEAIYGEDNRIDVVHTHNKNYHQWASATAALIPNKFLFDSSPEISMRPDLLLLKDLIVGDSKRCSYDRFTDQPSAAVCSGFLISSNILVTAGHCTDQFGGCLPDYAWVFDYKLETVFSSKVQILAQNIYSCKKVLLTEYDSYSGVDIALIELDRKAVGRVPLKTSFMASISKGTPLITIGHPEGLPTKISTEGIVRESYRGTVFSTNLDAFVGSSGSPVINKITGLVEGILVRGEFDYVKDESNNCMTPKICLDTNCFGEEVTKITSIKNLKDYLAD